MIYDYVTGKEFAQWVRGMMDYMKEQRLHLEKDMRHHVKSIESNTSLTLSTNALESFDGNLEITSITHTTGNLILVFKRVPKHLNVGTFVVRVLQLVSDFLPQQVEKQ